MARLPKRGGPDGGLLRLAERTGIRKGMGGSKPWFYVGTGLWTLRTVRRLAERKTEILVSEQLKPGQRIIISNGRATVEDTDVEAPLDTQRQGRKARKAERKQAAKSAKRAKKSVPADA